MNGKHRRNAQDGAADDVAAEKNNHPFYVVYTNTPGEIVYEDRYQVCCKVEEPEIMAVQPSWSPED